MSRLRVAVIGCGHLGSIHARLIQSLEEVELVAVVDTQAAARERVATQCNCPAVAELRQLTGQLDAAIVATPTIHHHAVACELLQQDVHLLLEKPMTSTVEEADELIVLARRQHLVLQVGHVERFNPAWNAVAPHLQTPQYVEAVRAGGYTFRSTDVSIVHDLMIHDLDLVLSLAQSPVVDVDAMGLAIFGPHADLALARLRFQNGCVADLKASRVNYAPQRTMHIFARHAHAAIDFAKGQAELVRPSREVLAGQVDLTRCPAEQRPLVQETLFEKLLVRETVTVERGNAILEEQREFVNAIRRGTPVRVSGEQGREALAVAERILSSMAVHQWNGTDHIGPHALFLPAAMPARRAA